MNHRDGDLSGGSAEASAEAEERLTDTLDENEMIVALHQAGGAVEQAGGAVDTIEDAASGGEDQGDVEAVFESEALPSAFDVRAFTQREALNQSLRS